jgi:hypothetical protein
MDPKDIARMITEDPDIIAETVYHVTRKENIEDIKRDGLGWDVERRSYKPGDGVYVFPDLKAWPAVANWLNIQDPVILELDLDIDDPEMLMDEDALSGLATTDILADNFIQQYPELAKELQEILDGIGHRNEEQLAIAKTEFIDKYKIPPLDPALMGRSTVHSARYPRPVPPGLIKRAFQGDPNAQYHYDPSVVPFDLR